MTADGLRLGLPVEPDQALEAEELKACCASAYAHPAVRWLLGDELHPGGVATTRQALELIDLGPSDHLLDIAAGAGDSALLAARERGTRVTGLDYSVTAVDGAIAAAAEQGLADRVDFIHGDAESLPFPDASFDALLCECSLCTFPDKATAVTEMRRVLRPGGRAAIADVVVDRGRLPSELLGGMAAIACVGDALDRDGYEQLLADADLRVFAVESRDREAEALAERVEERLRGARMLGSPNPLGSAPGAANAIDLVRTARRAIAEGALGYAIFAAS